MTELFTGKAVPNSVSLPEDLWAYLRRRRENVGIPVSRQIKDAIEESIKAVQAPARPDRVLVDSGCDYTTEGE